MTMLLPFRTASSSLMVVALGGLLAGAGCGDSGSGGTGGASGSASGGAPGGASGGAGTTGAAGAAAGSGGGTAGVGGGAAGAAGGATAGGGGSNTAGAPGTAGATGAAGATGTAGATGAAGATGTAGGGGGAGGGTSALMNFFVSSKGSPTANGNLGGLTGADQLCQTLATAVGQGSGKTWRAYLSAANPTTIHARDRIGEGPYYNARGAMVAATKAALHSAVGDAALFLDERGGRINGQWSGSPTPNQHDIYTGSNRAGMLAGADMTCADWTATTGNTQVGHSDGMGPGGSTSMVNYTYWSGSHSSGCNDPTPAGGAGKIYCFVGP